MENQPIHFDPEFQTFTYGDPNHPKRKLGTLNKGDLLVFYAGLEGFDFVSQPALYLIGYFEVEMAGMASSFTPSQISTHFSQNFHVRHQSLFAQQVNHLVLVKGAEGSRLFQKAHLFSETQIVPGKPPLKVISPQMRDIFGHFNNRYSFQRNPTRWVDPAYVNSAANFVRSLA